MAEIGAQAAGGKGKETEVSPAGPSVSHGGQAIRTITFEMAVPDLRNGALASIQQAAVRSAMQPLYYWPTIFGLDPARAVDAAEHLFRAHNVSLDEGFGDTMTASQRADNRKWAIVLAGVRSGAHAAWRLKLEDMTAKELISSGMEQAVDVIRQKSSGSTSSGKWTAARSVKEMTALEMEVLGMCAYMGMAIPVLQGASLIQTGHHYVPSTYSIFKGLRRQALGSVSKDASTWVESLGERFDDLAFHKACHPVSPTLKRELAVRQDIASKLAASGHGSVAIRLPAIPSEATGGKAALALVRTANKIIGEMGTAVRVEEGTRLMEALEEARVGEERSTACDAVVAWIERHAAFFAFCAGIVQHIHDTSGTGKNTLLSAYSVKKMMSANPTDVAKGVAFARAAAERTRDRMERGEYVVATAAV